MSRELDTHSLQNVKSVQFVETNLDRQMVGLYYHDGSSDRIEGNIDNALRWFLSSKSPTQIYGISISYEMHTATVFYLDEKPL